LLFYITNSMRYLITSSKVHAAAKIKFMRSSRSQIKKTFAVKTLLESQFRRGTLLKRMKNVGNKRSMGKIIISAVARVSEAPPGISRGAPHTLLAYYYELQ